MSFRPPNYNDLQRVAFLQQQQLPPQQFMLTPQPKQPPPHLQPQQQLPPQQQQQMPPQQMPPQQMPPQQMPSMQRQTSSSNLQPQEQQARYQQQVQQQQRSLAGFPSVDPRLAATKRDGGIRVPLGAINQQHMRPWLAQQQQVQQQQQAQQQQQQAQQQQVQQQQQAQQQAQAALVRSSFKPSLGIHGSPVTPGLSIGALGVTQKTFGTSTVTHPSILEGDFSYTEIILRGLLSKSQFSLETITQSLLPAITGSQFQGGIWKTECWRSVIDNPQQNLLGSQQPTADELWLRQYIQPTHLRGLNLVRIFSPEHLVVTKDSPVNARRVTESSVGAGFSKVLSSLGFRRRPENNVYTVAHLFHINGGQRGNHLQLTIQKQFSDEKCQEELFPCEHLVEVSARVTDDALLETASRKMLEFVRAIDMFAHMSRL